MKIKNKPCYRYLKRKQKTKSTQGFFFKHQVSCVNGFLTGNARKQSGALQIKKRLLQYIFSLIKTELMLDFPLLLSPHGFGENTPPLNTLSLTLCIYMSDSFVVYLHQFFISGRRKKTHSTDASLNMYMSASAVLYRSKPCILVGSIGGNSANLNTGLLYLLQI